MPSSSADGCRSPDSASKLERIFNTLRVAARSGDHDDLSVYGLDGAEIRRIPTTVQFRSELDNGMAVRTDGQSAVVSAMPPGQGKQVAQLLSIDMTTGKVVKLTPQPGMSQASPVFVSQQTVLFSSGMLYGDSSQLTSFDLTTGKTAVLSGRTQAVRGTAAALGVDRVDYEVTSDEGVELWPVSLRGGAPRRLHIDDGAWPSMDPTGRWLFILRVASRREPGSRLTLIPLNT